MASNVVDKCVICNTLLTNSPVREIKSKALENLKQRSISLKDNKHLFFETKKFILVHDKCRQAYFKDTWRVENQSEPQKPPLLRSSSITNIFDFKEKCIF